MCWSRDGGGHEKAFLNKAGGLSAGRSHACTWRLIVTSRDGDRHHKDRGIRAQPRPWARRSGVTSALPTCGQGMLPQDGDRECPAVPTAAAQSGNGDKAQ